MPAPMYPTESAELSLEQQTSLRQARRFKAAVIGTALAVSFVAGFATHSGAVGLFSFLGTAAAGYWFQMCDEWSRH